MLSLRPFVEVLQHEGGERAGDVDAGGGPFEQRQQGQQPRLPQAEFGTAFAAGETAGTRTLFLLGGLVSVAFGVVLLARPGVGAFTLALLYGLFALFYGVTQIAAGTQLRGVGRDVRSVLHRAAA